MADMIPRGNSPTELRRAFQWTKRNGEISSYTTVTSMATDDFIAVWDTSEGLNSKITFANFEAALAHDNIIAGTIASHDTSATGAELDTLTDDSMAETLHRHSSLSASDGVPDANLNLNATGQVAIGHQDADYLLDVRKVGGTQVAQIHVSYGDGDWGGYIQSFGSSGIALMGGVAYDSGVGWVAKWTESCLFNVAAGEFYIFCNDGLTVGNTFTPNRIFRASYDNVAKFGSSGTAGDSRLEIETEADEGRQAFTLHQKDTDQAFIDFQGSSKASANDSLSIWTGGATIAGYTRQEINGTVYWMPYFNAPTGMSGELAELTNLTDDSMVDTLHRHSELSASDGTPDGVVKVDASGITAIGDGGTTDYSEFEADGTLQFHGAATVWDDLRIVPGAFSFAGSADPALVSWQPGGSGATFKVYEFAKNDEVFATCQMPHGYKEGSDIWFHLHWTPHAYGATENGNNVGWKVDYSIADVGDAFPASSTAVLTDACSGTDHKHEITSSVQITGTGLAISHMILLRIYRSDTGADDTWSSVTPSELPVLLEFDIHYEMDTVGSRAETSK